MAPVGQHGFERDTFLLTATRHNPIGPTKDKNLTLATKHSLSHCKNSVALSPMAALLASISSINPLFLSKPTTSLPPPKNYRRFSPSLVSLSSSSSKKSHNLSSTEKSESISPPNPSSSKLPFAESSKQAEKRVNYALANPNGSPVARFVRSTESSIERVKI